MKVGETHRWNNESDPFGGQYRVVQNLGGGKWEIEHLPADDQTTGAIFDYWASVEARGGMTAPIWDKTWAECTGDERPQRIGHLTYEQELERDLARYAERAGQRMTIKVVSRKQWDAHF